MTAIANVLLTSTFEYQRQRINELTQRLNSLSITDDAIDVAGISVSANLINTNTEVRFYDSDDSHYVALKSPDTVVANVVWLLPSSDGATGSFLMTDGSGNTSWNDISLGTDTTGDYVESLTGGYGIKILNGTGVGSTPTILANTSNLVDLANTQTLSNKTLDSSTTINKTPVITLGGALTGTITLTNLGNDTVQANLASSVTANNITMDGGVAVGDIHDYGTLTSNIAINFALSNNFKFGFTANVTLLTPTGLTAGQTGMIQITGGSTEVLSFASEWKFPEQDIPDTTAIANTSAIHYLDYYIANSTFVRTVYSADYRS